MFSAQRSSTIKTCSGNLADALSGFRHLPTTLPGPLDTIVRRFPTTLCSFLAIIKIHKCTLRRAPGARKLRHGGSVCHRRRRGELAQDQPSRSPTWRHQQLDVQRTKYRVRSAGQYRRFGWSESSSATRAVEIAPLTSAQRHSNDPCQHVRQRLRACRTRRRSGRPLPQRIHSGDCRERLLFQRSALGLLLIWHSFCAASAHRQACATNQISGSSSASRRRRWTRRRRGISKLCRLSDCWKTFLNSVSSHLLVVPLMFLKCALMYYYCTYGFGRLLCPAKKVCYVMLLAQFIGSTATDSFLERG